jgi:hypothetical protein
MDTNNSRLMRALLGFNPTHPIPDNLVLSKQFFTDFI